MLHKPAGLYAARACTSALPVHAQARSEEVCRQSHTWGPAWQQPATTPRAGLSAACAGTGALKNTPQAVTHLQAMVARLPRTPAHQAGSQQQQPRAPVQASPQQQHPGQAQRSPQQQYLGQAQHSPQQQHPGQAQPSPQQQQQHAGQAPLPAQQVPTPQQQPLASEPAEGAYLAPWAYQWLPGDTVLALVEIVAAGLCRPQGEFKAALRHLATAQAMLEQQCREAGLHQVRCQVYSSRCPVWLQKPSTVSGCWQP